MQDPLVQPIIDALLMEDNEDNDDNDDQHIIDIPEDDDDQGKY